MIAAGRQCATDLVCERQGLSKLGAKQPTMKRQVVIAATIAVSPMPLAAQAIDPFSDVIAATSQNISKPAKGLQLTVSAGEAILDQRNVRSADGVRLDAPAVSPAKLAAQFVFVTGEQLYRVNTSKAFKACWTKLGSEGYPPCLIDDDGDGRFDRAASNSMRKAYPLATPVAYHRDTVFLPPVTAGLTRSILYQGATADGLKLSYREFSNDLARPAFSEDIIIPITKSFPQQFAVKGAVFTIFGIDGLGLTYQVDNPGPFDPTAAIAP